MREGYSTKGFPSHLESNPVILRARIEKANTYINDYIDVISSTTKAPEEAEFCFQEIWQALRDIRTIIGGL